MEILPISELLEQIKDFNFTENIQNYLTKFNAKVFLIEENYIDKDYLINYSAFYARSFRDIERRTKRLHFFSSEFDETTLRNAMLDTSAGIKEDLLKRLNESYLGFITITPVQDEFGSNIIGKTILKHPNVPNSEISKFISNEYKVHLYGFLLKVNGLQFQSQDKAVGACATVTIWMCLRALNGLFGTKMESPAEITKHASSVIGEGRDFPSPGLTIEQMLWYIKSLGLDTEVIKSNDTMHSKYPNILIDAIKAYINCGIPIIAALEMAQDKGSKDIDRHAVVIGGYQEIEDSLSLKIYLHDDQVGPYREVLLEDYNNIKKSFWTDKKLNAEPYQSVKIEKLIIPVYEKIRLTFNRIYGKYLNINLSRDSRKGKKLLLEDSNKYKIFLLEKNIVSKVEILEKSLPKYLWILRLYSNNLITFDKIFDATDVIPIELAEVIYQ